jgi:hypothetical protein
MRGEEKQGNKSRQRRRKVRERGKEDKREANVQTA